MALSIKELFTYKKAISLVDNNGKEVAKAWVRLLGEEELNLAYKMSRVASLHKREKFRDHSSVDYSDEIAPVADLTREELLEMILEAQKNKVTSQAFVKVDREEIPKIEEFAQEPDAPTLEDQEKLDKAFDDQKSDFDKRIDDYISSRLITIRQEMDQNSTEELVKIAQEEMIGILPLNTFFIELAAQKAWRGTFEDAKCTKRIFDSVEEFYNADPLLKKQLTTAYSTLELGSDDIKN